MQTSWQNQRQTGELRHTQTLAGRTCCCAPRLDQKQFFLEQRHHTQAPAGLAVEQHGQVQLAGVEHGRQMARQAFDHVQAYIGVTLAHGAQQRQAQHGGGGRRHAHADATSQTRLLRRAHGLFGVAQYQLRLMKKRQPGFGGRHALGAALQQTGRELALQPADLLAQRRLHQLEILRSAADAAQFDDADKVAQLAQFHLKPPRAA